MSAARIALVDYGIGNVMSVANALERLEAAVTVVGDGDALLALEPACIVMPGVGAVGEALRLIRERGLEDALDALVVKRGIAYLGICVGMQVMAERCLEFGEHRGLGWIPGEVVRLSPADASLRLPHIGWNSVEVSPDADFMRAVDGEHFYFVHSYAMQCPDEYVAARTDYGGQFVSAVRRERMMGVQFHPEKSSAAGEALLRGLVASVLPETV